MSNRNWILLAAVLAGASVPSPVPAEDACLSDAQRLCSATPPGDGRVYFCLRSSWNQLSAGCQALLNWAQQRANEVTLDCQGDAFAYCQGVPSGQGRLYACLAGHRGQISSECKKGLELVDWFNASCGADRARLCPGVPKGDGGVIACLVTRRDQLSRACQAVFWP
jgi:hypothetical protein